MMTKHSMQPEPFLKGPLSMNVINNSMALSLEIQSNATVPHIRSDQRHSRWSLSFVVIATSVTRFRVPFPLIQANGIMLMHAEEDFSLGTGVRDMSRQEDMQCRSPSSCSEVFAWYPEYKDNGRSDQKFIQKILTPNQECSCSLEQHRVFCPIANVLDLLCKSNDGDWEWLGGIASCS